MQIIPAENYPLKVASIVVVIVMTMPAAMTAMIVPLARIAIAAVSIAVVDGRGRIDGGRRRFVHDGGRRLDINGRRHAESHADIDVRERRRGCARGNETCCANECEAFQRRAPVWACGACAGECQSMASDGHCRNAAVLMLHPSCCVCNG